jgi:hypothetical protein
MRKMFSKVTSVLAEAKIHFFSAHSACENIFWRTKHLYTSVNLFSLAFEKKKIN